MLHDRLQGSSLQIAIVIRDRHAQHRFRGMFENVMAAADAMDIESGAFERADQTLRVHNWKRLDHAVYADARLENAAIAQSHS